MLERKAATERPGCDHSDPERRGQDVGSDRTGVWGYDSLRGKDVRGGVGVKITPLRCKETTLTRRRRKPQGALHWGRAPRKETPARAHAALMSTPSCSLAQVILSPEMNLTVPHTHPDPCLMQPLRLLAQVQNHSPSRGGGDQEAESVRRKTKFHWR